MGKIYYVTINDFRVSPYFAFECHAKEFAKIYKIEDYKIESEPVLDYCPPVEYDCYYER